jgi:predicted ATPase/class 3 adenylate cyclase
MRNDLPTGTVTFLFTDIEGSTKLLLDLGAAAYEHMLAEHHRLLREACAAHHGFVVDTAGDAFFMAFATAGDALAAAAEAQRALSSSPVHVRMGVHTGAPRLTAQDYVGIDVHKAARIAAAGHGGQVLLSKATRELVDVGVTDLGEHHLKDFAAPVWIFQLGAAHHPPLRTISNTNLPRPASSFVGREREVGDVTALLRNDARLLTLTGAGGSGKTRLAIEAAVDLVPTFKGGVRWVALAVVRDPGLVRQVVAEALGTRDVDLADHIGHRELLLLLDNFEQVVGAAPQLSTLLEVCPNLKLLVTSREVLRVRGEVEYPVPPLSDPEALILFSTRSRLDADPVSAILCRRLDNLPLALELAAARTAVLSPAQILDRLSQRLDLLKGGRDADAKQRTLRSTIEWSYDLLDEQEKRLFGRLGVFAGGCTLACAEEVAGADIDVLESLVDKSLIGHSAERFWMLETIREYALECLRGSGEEDDVRSRHLAWFVALVQQSDIDLSGPLQRDVARKMETEFANVRAAFEWSVASDDIEAGLRLVSVRRFWQVLQEHQAEAIAWTETLVARAGAIDPSLRARTLAIAGEVRRVQGDLDKACQHLEAALSIQRGLGDTAALCRPLYMLGRAETAAGRYQRGHELTEEGVAIARATGDRQALGELLAQLGETAYELGMAERARTFLDEAQTVSRETGDAHTLADAQRILAMIECDVSRFEDARSLLREALTLQRELSDWSCASLSLSTLGDICLREQDYVAANALFLEAVALLDTHNNAFRQGDSLWGLAAAAAGNQQWERAVRLLGAAQALRGDAPIRLATPQRQEAMREEVRRHVTEKAFGAALAEGSAMSLEEALACAVADQQDPAIRDGAA